MTTQNDLASVVRNSAQVSPAMAAAWERYQATLEELRTKIYSGKAIELGDAAQAHYLFHQLQAVAFNTVIAPHQEYPRIIVQTLYEPMVYTWGLPCADFHYGNLFLDGAREYRVWGKRGTTLFTQILAMTGYMSDQDTKVLGMWTLDEFERQADGSFEIFLGGRQRGKNWLPLDPDSGNNWIAFREAYYDWDNDRGNEMHVELLGGPARRPVVHDEQEFIRRLDGAARMMQFCIANYATMYFDSILPVAGFNRFHINDQSDNLKRGASPAAGYIACVYRLDSDEALLIELDVPKEATYWSFQLADIWSQAADFLYHQTSLNGHQIRRDSDGKVRVVVAQRDPGIHNWLDTLAIATGSLLLRWYYLAEAVIPTARKIKLAELRDLLPQDTPQVLPEEREAILRKRARAGLSRYHY